MIVSLIQEPFRFGLETLVEQPPRVTVYHHNHASPTSDAPSLSSRLADKRIALLSHPAGVDRELDSGVNVLSRWLAARDAVDRWAPPPRGARLTALLGPQHGIRGEKQDNMVESADDVDEATGLPTYSLYGTTRRLTPAMIDAFDVLLVDMQDVGVRVYTFLTTLGYILEDLAERPDKEVWVLDRPNPTGRAIEGLLLEPGHESFVGIASIPMQHGLTLGEFARWYCAERRLSTCLTVVPMTGWSADPAAAWPTDRVWIPPSPNMPSVATARCYAGTVMVEGATLSEARGTTRPLSMVGHPDVDWTAVYDWVSTHAHGAVAPGTSPDEEEPAAESSGGHPADGTITAHARERSTMPVTAGCRVRSVTFQPTFHKHTGRPTAGWDIVAEGRFWDPARFRPYRLVAAVFKAIRSLYPELPLWTDPPYEYEYERIPIDVITGGTRLREWVEDPGASWRELAGPMAAEEAHWYSVSRRWWLY